MLTQTDIARLAAMGNALRPDWPQASLYAGIAKRHAHRAYRDVAVALAWVATDRRADGSPATETPGRLDEAGPWWRAAASDGSAPRKLDVPCPEHRDQVLPCRRCAADSVPSESSTALTEARAELARVLANRCGHGIVRGHGKCADCEAEQPTEGANA